MDPATIGVAISGAAATAQIFELIRNTAAKAKEDGDNELLGVLAEVQLRLIALADENRALKERIRELENEKNIETHYDAYWVRNDDGSIDGPFELEAYDTERILRRMVFNRMQDGNVVFGARDRQTALVPVSFLRDQKYPLLDELEERSRRAK